jgi:hypothetical protein
MSLIDRMKRWISGAAAADEGQDAPEGEDRHAEIDGLNFMGAIDAHMKWKNRLTAYIQGRGGENLMVEIVSNDDQCALGRWLHGPAGARYREIPTFTEIEHYHAQFHRSAGQVLATAQAGRRDEAMELLQHGDYLRNSERVKMLLAKLFVQLHEQPKS